MLLTLFYMAATWVQSWRLSLMREKITQLLTCSGSLVLYKEPDPAPTDSEGSVGLQIVGVSSSSCINKSEARVGDLLWYSDNKRACSVFPQQRVDVTRWISFGTERCTFPIEVNGGSSKVELCDEHKLHILIEADYMKATSIRDANYCKLEQFGLPQVWLASDYFGLILETDVEHLANLGSRFMTGKLSIDDGMELVRIESVCVEGRPCLMLNAGSLPITQSNATQDKSLQQEVPSLVSDMSERRISVQMSLVQWRTRIQLLQSLTQAAEKAASSQEEIRVGGHSLVVGSQPLTLTPLAAIPVPSQLETDLTLTDTSSSLTVKSVSEEKMTTGLPEVVPSAIAPHEDKSVDSFHSLTEELDNLSHAVGSDVAAKNGPSAIPEEELSEQPTSPSTVSVTSHTGGAKAVLNQEVGVPSCVDPMLAVRRPGKQKMTFSTSMKPPNVLVYSESSVALENVKTVIHSTLQRHKYTIYTVSKSTLLSSPWSDNTVLLVVCGTVADVLAPTFVNYLLNGGHILCMCSDFLHLILPTFRTAEVRERELVRFSYGRWKQVQMMHHIFCYQASPARTRFSPREPENVVEPPQPSCNTRAPQPPSSVQVLDGDDKPHTLQVQVLGAEETWHTPSLLLAVVSGGHGKVVFSQVHLEVDPIQYEDEESKFTALKESDTARLEIIQDLLSTHLGMQCTTSQKIPTYTPGYFLGRHETKLEFLQHLHDRLEGDNILKNSQMSLQFCTAKGVEPPKATANFMPVLVHACPANFSTIEYFENLQSEVVGRLVIYSDVMTSSMNVLSGVSLQHGLVVVPRQQTSGVGRGGNMWLSPEGSAMFSVQLHVPLASYLGQHAPLLQHVVALAVVSAVCNLPGYQDLDLRLKWPNDIYAGRSAKLGGVIVNSTPEKTFVVCNVGLGVNLNNQAPTTCINEMIVQLSSTTNEKLAPLSCEKLLSITFTQLEGLLNAVQMGHVRQVLDLYYSYWLHSDAEITVVGPRGSSQRATVIGVDDFGFLRVRGQDGMPFSVHPDGNSFDMLRGLVAPSVK
ncbi:biotin--protein ligase isoform X2 [Zootermopsis nevadensis]|uniref:biotin--protein ligase isoform X2 n=1 Tax=Zootermopsis nevadensis TaxID=136037 RepID=UPI000B8E3348|nr:biotin--protein ligase isoform X2 [Zootermopsis nevadensis]